MIELQNCAGSKRQVTEYRDNENDRDNGQGKALRRKYERLRFRLATVRVTGSSLHQQFSKERDDLLHGVWTDRHTACTARKFNP